MQMFTKFMKNAVQQTLTELLITSDVFFRLGSIAYLMAWHAVTSYVVRNRLPFFQNILEKLKGRVLFTFNQRRGYLIL